MRDFNPLDGVSSDDLRRELSSRGEGVDSAIREYVVSRMTLIIDNIEPMYIAATEAAVEALNDNGVSSKYEFGEAAAGRGPYGREDLYVEIGSAVSDVVKGWIDSAECSDGLRTLILDVLDLGDRQQWQLLGAHYWPGDDEAFDDDEDEDIPADHPVRPLGPGEVGADPVTCGECGRTWDDAVVTSLTPAPGARCPFESFH